MTRTVTWGKPNRRKDGHIGARASVTIRREGGADGVYTIDSHGLSSEQVANEVDRIHSFHDARASRMNGLRAIQATPLDIGGVIYRVVDLTILYPADASYCSLYFDVRRIENGRKVRVWPEPKRRLFKTPSEIPTDAEIVAIIRDAIPTEIGDLDGLHEAFTKKVNEKLKKRGGA